MSQMILHTKEPETLATLVETEQSQGGIKLPALGLSWEDFMGLSWGCEEEW